MAAPWQIQSAGSPPVNQALSQARQLAQAEVKVRQEIRDDLKKEQLEQVRQHAYRNVTGQLPPDVLQRRQARAVAAAHQAGGAAQQSVGLAQAYAPHQERSPLAAAGSAIGAFASLPGPIGAVASGLSAVVSVAGYLSTAFKDVRESAAQLHQAQQQHLQDLRGGRQTGVSPADALRRALTEQEHAQLAQAQATNNVPRQRQILDQAEARHRQTAAQNAGPEVAQRQARAQQELQELEDRSRGGWWRGTHNARALNRQREEILARHGVETFLGNESTPMIRDQIRQLAELVGGPSVQAQGGLQTLRNVRRGGVPNLAPGAPNLEDLPRLFQSHQGDVLDIHAQVQQEAVRDMREQRQFEEQMRLWEEIFRWWQAHPPVGPLS